MRSYASEGVRDALDERFPRIMGDLRKVLPSFPPVKEKEPVAEPVAEPAANDDALKVDTGAAAEHVEGEAVVRVAHQPAGTEVWLCPEENRNRQRRRER